MVISALDFYHGERNDGNTIAVITGDATGSVIEDSATQSTTSGTLNITDPDDEEDKFQAPSAAALLGAYGSWTFDDTSGAWAYTLDNSNSAVQALDEGNTLIENLTIQSIDSTATQTIKVTINGQNEPINPEPKLFARSILEKQDYTRQSSRHPHKSGPRIRHPLRRFQNIV